MKVLNNVEKYRADDFFQLLDIGETNNKLKPDLLSEKLTPFHFTIDSLMNGEMLPLPSGRYVVYGAGNASTRILPKLQQFPGVEFVGFLDQNFQKLKTHNGLDVHDPRLAATLECDYFLPLHPQAEALMSDTLQKKWYPQ